MIFCATGVEGEMHNHNCPKDVGIVSDSSFEELNVSTCVLTLDVEVYKEDIVVGVVVVCGSRSNSVLGAEAGEIVVVSVKHGVVVSRTV